MRILVASDSFKGSMSSEQVGYVISECFRGKCPDVNIRYIKCGDGGEGTSEALVQNTEYSKVRLKVSPVNAGSSDNIECSYYLTSEKEAYIEIARTTGLDLVPSDRRDIFRANTYGFGECIENALDLGSENITLCLGGSASNDAGIGMLMALGYRFYDQNGIRLCSGSQNIPKICSVDVTKRDERLDGCHFTAACDVNNPLTGSNGCSRVYGRQKGASEDQIDELDDALKKYAMVVEKAVPGSDRYFPGSGAAGGTAFSLKYFLDASIVSGAELLFEKLNIEPEVEKADLVITGEGKIDSQTMMGKFPYMLASICKRKKKNVIAFCGKDDTKTSGESTDIFDEIYEISDDDSDENTNMKEASENLKRTLYKVIPDIVEKYFR